jgi:hypothetical protein
MWSIYRLIMIDTLLLRPSLHFTTLHPATLHSTSLHLSTLHFFPFKIYPTALHCPLIWLKPVYISYRSFSLHIIIIIRHQLALNRPVSASSNSLFKRSSKSSSSIWSIIRHYFWHPAAVCLNVPKWRSTFYVFESRAQPGLSWVLGPIFGTQQNTDWLYCNTQGHDILFIKQVNISVESLIETLHREAIQKQ